MATEDELPEELDKLEITPVLPHVKLLDSNLPVQLNPFFENDLKDTRPDSKIDLAAGCSTVTIQSAVSLNTTRTAIVNCRRCRYRRASESVLDELKQNSTNATVDSVESSRTPPNGVLKQTLKKTTTSSVGGPGNRKVLIREPILKALQTCLHPNSNVRRKLLASANTSTTAAVGNEGPLTSKGMSDFRDLIDECRNLLAEDVDFSGRLNQISLSNRNSKNFTTIQTPKIQNNKLRNNRRPILNTGTLSLPSPELAIANDAHNMPLLQPSLLASSIISTSLPQRSNSSNLSPDHVSNHARCSTTCSQQAGNSAAAAACDDVTIDELASYFDTFVHIPKKMSSMAEMMYI